MNLNSSKSNITITYIKGEDIVSQTVTTDNQTKVSFDNQCLILSDEEGVIFLIPLLKLITISCNKGE